MSTKNIIRKVNVHLDGAYLKCDIVSRAGEDGADLEYAFYVNKNNKRIATRWYSVDPRFSFDTEGLGGHYQVIGFARHADSTTHSEKSSPIFCNPVLLEEPEKIDDYGEISALVLKGDHWEFPALYFQKKSELLFVLLPSAVDRERITLPSFSRWTWAAQGIFPGNVLCVADPTLQMHQDLKLGWMIGSEAHDATQDLATWISKVAAKKGIPNERIFFYGSSAGGFSALAIAALVPGSTAIAINAQTEALEYHIRSQVSLVSEACFGIQDANQILLRFSDRLSMTSKWKNIKSSKVFLIQNRLDRHHYDVHFSKFWTSLGGRPEFGEHSVGRHRAWIFDNPAGHDVAESLEMAEAILKKVTAGVQGPQ